MTDTNQAIAIPDPRLPDAEATDDRVVELWLHGRSAHTRRAYLADIRALRRFTPGRLGEVTLGDLQGFADSLSGSPATRARRLMAVKSLLSFAARIGATSFNVGAALRVPSSENRLAERILTEEQVGAMLAAVEGHTRDHALLRLLYNAGLRVSEIVGLRWRNLNDGTVTVLGKGSKTRTVRLSKGTWSELVVLRKGAGADDLVFPMSTTNVLLRVRRAAKFAGIEGKVSPHFLRHSHASHALHRGSDLATIRDTLGHSSVAVTSRYVHARPNKSSGDYLPV